MAAAKAADEREVAVLLRAQADFRGHARADRGTWGTATERGRKWQITWEICFLGLKAEECGYTSTHAGKYQQRLRERLEKVATEDMREVLNWYSGRRSEHLRPARGLLPRTPFE